MRLHKRKANTARCALLLCAHEGAAPGDEWRRKVSNFACTLFRKPKQNEVLILWPQMRNRFWRSDFRGSSLFARFSNFELGERTLLIINIDFISIDAL